MKIKINYSDKNVNFVLNSPEDYIQETIIKTKNFYEIGMLEDIRQRLEVVSGDKTIVDVGAYIGEHSLFFAFFCNADVYSFEPFKKSYENLLENIHANKLEDKIKAFNIALGARAEIGEMAESPGNAGMNKVIKNAQGSTKVASLDGLIPEQTRVNVIKIDVEGMELDVLRGSRKIIKRDHPLIYVEAFEDEKHEQITKFLRRHQYTEAGVFNNTPTYLFIFTPQPTVAYRLGRRVLPRPVKKVIAKTLKIER